MGRSAFPFLLSRCCYADMGIHRSSGLWQPLRGEVLDSLVCAMKPAERVLKEKVHGALAKCYRYCYQ